MVTVTRLIASSEVEVARPILAEVGRTVADVQVRNRGTLGGNICVNDPTNHFPPLLVALGASMTILGTGGERVVSAEDFFVGVYETDVHEGELLTAISVPTRTPGGGDALAGVTMGAHGTYVANAAASVTNGAWRIALGCVAAVPLRATTVEERLSGVDLAEEDVRAAVEGLGASLDPPGDVHASADYRRHLAEVSVVRAVLQAAARGKG
jgi:carbon-monoxide dehydrogenase medium subunit